MSFINSQLLASPSSQRVARLSFTSLATSRRRLHTRAHLSTEMPIQSKTKQARLLHSSDDADLSLAANMLRLGQLVAFPTETVYGLGADATNSEAVNSIFAAKRRPSDNPLIVHLSHVDDLSKHNLTPLPFSPIAKQLANAFWPGPLTLILPLADSSPLSTAVTAGLDSVAIRIPLHPVARALLARAQLPIAAPSANLSGRPSPTCAQHVFKDLSEVIDGIVDFSDDQLDDPFSQVGLESTVVDLTSRPTVLRPGAISLEQLEKATGVQFFRETAMTNGNNTPKAPGMKYRHYAPIAPLYIVYEYLLATLRQWESKKKRVGILADESICATVPKQDNFVCVPCGDKNNAEGFGRSLYAALRAFDGEGDFAVSPPVDVILAVPPHDVNQGIGEAVMNRLRKAAAGREEGTRKK